MFVVFLFYCLLFFYRVLLLVHLLSFIVYCFIDLLFIVYCLLYILCGYCFYCVVIVFLLFFIVFYCVSASTNSYILVRIMLLFSKLVD